MENSKYFRMLKTGPDDAGRRLDRVLRKALPDYSLSLIHRLLRQGKVLIDGKPASPGDKVPLGGVIQVVIHVSEEKTGSGEWGVGNGERCSQYQSTTRKQYRSSNNNTYSLLPTPQSLILWQGSGIMVLNKPPGMATHGDDSLDTLVNAWLGDKLPPSLSFRPGPLHRLDKPSSGAVAFSTTIEGARLFSRLLRERMIAKTYLAIVEGRMSGEAVWSDELARDSRAGKTFAALGKTGAKNALTAVKALASNNSYTLIEARIATGRTHQIRAQAATHGHPLSGDRKYGGHGSPAGGFFLHAWKLDTNGHIAGFPRPLTAPLPPPFTERIIALFGKF